MKRFLSIVAFLAILFALAFPAQAAVVGYRSGDLVIKALDKRVGAVFRNVNEPNERYVFRIPAFVEFRDNDQSGNLTQGDEIVAVGILKRLTLTLESGGNYVNLTRTGTIEVFGQHSGTAEVLVYLEVTNATLNEAKRGLRLERPRASGDDLLAMIVLFAAVDPNMSMHACRRKHAHGKLEIEQEATRAEIVYESSCLCGEKFERVNVTAFARGHERMHSIGVSEDASLATQVVFPYGSVIVYDPRITVEKLGFSLTSGYGLLATLIAILLVIGAIVVVLRNHSRRIFSFNNAIRRIAA